MIKTDNPGTLEAIREVRTMGVGRTMRAVYEMKMKEIGNIILTLSVAG